MKRWWISWYESDLETFEYHGPWWTSGETLGEPVHYTICAAVVAEDEAAARAVITEAHDSRDDSTIPEWRFCNERPPDWSPFGERFERSEWMKWPWPKEAA